jgi:hypothetical protein
MALIDALAAQLGTTSLTQSLAGNLVLIGVAAVGLTAAAALLGTAREIHAERSDPLNERHYLNF